MIRYLADRFSQEAHLLNGYRWVYTPHIGRSVLWETSGHLDFYRESMYAPMTIDEEQYYVKPMNCPFHIQIYKGRRRSYRELPLRYAEFGTVYRYELSGTLQGLTRVRGFTQDDAHIFCRPEQAADEIRRALRFSLYVLRTFGLQDFTAYLSTRPAQKAIGSEEEWRAAEAALRAAIEGEGLPYQVDEGGGAFYGPKIDLKLLDALGREWQLSTVQFDFNLPARFDLEYVAEDGRMHRPHMVHRALFGSAERFFAMLIEHYAGAFPLWLAPVQAVVIPIAERHCAFAEEVAALLQAEGMRVEVNTSSERMNAKIRDAQIAKVPYALVLGDREVQNRTVSVRGREGGDQGAMSIEDFLKNTAADRARGKAELVSGPDTRDAKSPAS
jgi:threonyl-tRNA synthetase